MLGTTRPMTYKEVFVSHKEASGGSIPRGSLDQRLRQNPQQLSLVEVVPLSTEVSLREVYRRS